MVSFLTGLGEVAGGISKTLGPGQRQNALLREKEAEREQVKRLKQLELSQKKAGEAAKAVEALIGPIEAQAAENPAAFAGDELNVPRSQNILSGLTRLAASLPDGPRKIAVLQRIRNIPQIAAQTRSPQQKAFDTAKATAEGTEAAISPETRQQEAQKRANNFFSSVASASSKLSQGGAQQLLARFAAQDPEAGVFLADIGSKILSAEQQAAFRNKNLRVTTNAAGDTTVEFLEGPDSLTTATQTAAEKNLSSSKELIEGLKAQVSILDRVEDSVGLKGNLIELQNRFLAQIDESFFRADVEGARAFFTANREAFQRVINRDNRFSKDDRVGIKDLFVRLGIGESAPAAKQRTRSMLLFMANRMNEVAEELGLPATERDTDKLTPTKIALLTTVADIKGVATLINDRELTPVQGMQAMKLLFPPRI